MKAVRVVVTGKVQGVGFRNYVCMRALSLGVFGRVWNRADGAVEVEAQSENPQVLDEFVKSFWAGPGRVDSVEVAEIPAKGEWADFVIVR